MKNRLIKYIVFTLLFLWLVPYSVLANDQTPLPALSEAKLSANLYEIFYNKLVSATKNSPLINQINLFVSLVGQKIDSGKIEGITQTETKSIVKAKKRVLITAYSSTPDQTDSSPFITAKGTFVREGVVAANFLRFGTKIRIPEVYGDKVFVVEDRMAKYNNYKLDVWMESKTEALQFGAKRLTMEILN